LLQLVTIRQRLKSYQTDDVRLFKCSPSGSMRWDELFSKVFDRVIRCVPLISGCQNPFCPFLTSSLGYRRMHWQVGLFFCSFFFSRSISGTTFGVTKAARTAVTARCRLLTLTKPRATIHLHQHQHQPGNLAPSTGAAFVYGIRSCSPLLRFFFSAIDKTPTHRPTRQSSDPHPPCKSTNPARL
jgi:hypothetical protein